MGAIKGDTRSLDYSSYAVEALMRSSGAGSIESTIICLECTPKPY